MGLYRLEMKKLRGFFREHLEWPLTFFIMLVLLLSFIGLVVVLDGWFSSSTFGKRSYMSEYVDLLRGQKGGGS